MQVSRVGRDAEIACCRSVVKVAIPQRRGSELPITAMRRSGVMLVPRQSRLISANGRRTCRQIWSALQRPAAGRQRDQGCSSRGEASWTGLGLNRPGVGNSDGAFFMQFALPAIVKQAECRVAALLNLGEYDTGANGVDRSGGDEDDVAFRDGTPLREV